MLPQRPPFPVIRKLGKTEMISHVKEDPLEPLHRDLAHLRVSTTLGMNPPLAQLNNLLGPPLVTGRLVGGMKALPEGTLVGLGIPNLIHRTLGTKTRDSAKISTVDLCSFLSPLCTGLVP